MSRGNEASASRMKLERIAAEQHVRVAALPADAAAVARPVDGEFQERVVGLDALRGVAMLLGIVLHAAVPYLTTRLPNLLWPVHDVAPIVVFDALFWSIHVFRLPIFFVLAGYFAELLFARRGAEAFLQHRLQRLVIPYGIALFTIGPLTYVLFATGWYLTGRCTFSQILWPLGFSSLEIQHHFFGPAHLWFLLDLIWLSSAYLVLRRGWGTATASTSDSESGATSYDGPFVPLGFGFLSGMLLWGDTTPVLGFHNTFIPVPSRLLYFGVYFACGVVFRRDHDWFQRSIRHYQWHLWLALPCCCLSYFAIMQELAEPGVMHRLLAAVSIGVSAWLGIFGAFGFSVHYCRQIPAWLKYLAGAAYWVYLIHLPLVAVAQIALHRTAYPAGIKFLLVSVFALVTSLISYEYMVRDKTIGKLLNGSRPARQTPELRVLHRD